MKLEDQVAPLSLARRMKAVGFPQLTIHAWQDHVYPYVVTFDHADEWGYRDELDCAAPTLAEMGEWLPVIEGERLITERVGIELPQRWRVFYAWEEYDASGYTPDPLPPSGSTEAEARALLLIALAEAGSLDLKAIARGGRS